MREKNHATLVFRKKIVLELTISHLLDFSTDKELLRQQIELLRAAILPVFTANIPDNEFGQLIGCLINPQAYFHRLELLHTQPITVAQVQAYVLKLIVQHLYVAAKQAKLASEH